MAKPVQHASIAADSMIERTKSKLHKCSKCGKGYATKTTLMRHLDLHSKELLCQYCKKVFFSKIKLSSHIKHHHHTLLPQKKKDNVCKVCNKELATSSNVKKHMVIHTGERPYTCSFCEKTFNNLANCRRHERIHTRKGQNVCSFCPMTFQNRYECKQHERIHTEEKGPYACSLCEKTFHYKFVFKEHECLHSPYACSFCGKSFQYKLNFKKHELVHAGEKPYPCSFCQKTYNNRTNCKRHEQRVHTWKREKPYVCAFCQATFQFKSHCKRHERTHTGKLPYVCETCHETFDSLSNLQHHVSTHTKKTPYKCGIRFGQSRALGSVLERQDETPQNRYNKSPASKPRISRKHLLPVQSHSSKVSYRKRHTLTVTNANSTELLSDCDQFGDDPLADPDCDTFEAQNKADGKFNGSEVNFQDVNKDSGKQSMPVDAATLGRKRGNSNTAVGGVSDQNKNSIDYEELLFETERTTSYKAQDSTMDSLVNSFVSVAKLHGVVLHMSVAADEEIVNLENGNQSNSNVDMGNPLSSKDIAKVLQLVNEKNNLQSKKAANPMKERTRDSAVGEAGNCQSEKSGYSDELLIQTDKRSCQPQNDSVIDTIMDSLVKALISAAKLQGVVLHVYCVK